MSAVKTLAVSVLILGAMATSANADPMLMNGGSGSWSFWMQGASVTPSSDAATSSPAPATTPPPPPSTPTTFSTMAAPSTSSTGNADAFLNFGSGPYPEASILTTGGAQPWYTSPVVEKFFGGQQPNSQQQSDFANAVLQDVQQTFQLSGGLAPKLTLDPTVTANHTISVVSGTSYGANPNAIGITDVGNNGFGFIDKLQYANSLGELEWAVAHNVSHELMHAFGVAVHHDTTGQYLDAASANWSLLTDPNTTFSQAAIDDIRSRNFTPNASGTTGAQMIDGDLEILAAPVPEPATVALWGLAIGGVVLQRRWKSRRQAA